MSDNVTSKTTCIQCGFVLKPGESGPCPECGGNVNHDVSITIRRFLKIEVGATVTRYTQEDLSQPEIRQEIALAIKGYSVMMQLLRQSRDLDSVSPRELEELIQQLLDADGWTTRLGAGQKDEGVIATTSYLTKDALTLVEQEKFHLGKCDRDDFREWLQRHARI